MRLYGMIFNPTNGTEKVASALSCERDCEQETVNLLEMDRDYEVYKLEAGDVCIVTIPSSDDRIPVVALERLSSMKGNRARAVLVTVYGNRGSGDTLLELKDTLEATGLRCVATVAAIAEHSIMHQFAAGRPDEKNAVQLEASVRQIREKPRGDKAQGPAFVPGNRPYWKYNGMPLRPKADKTYRQYGVCVRECPVHAIPKEDMTRAGEDICISCMRCIAVYPSGSRKLNKVMVNVATQKLKKAYTGPKQNELFL